MKLQYYMAVNVVIHISKSKGVAEMTNKTNKIKIKKRLSKVTSFTIHHVYSYREVQMFQSMYFSFSVVFIPIPIARCP